MTKTNAINLPEGGEDLRIVITRKILALQGESESAAFDLSTSDDNVSRDAEISIRLS